MGGVIIYSLCALTALACAWLLLQAYGRSRYVLLLWSGLCFVGLTVNNILVIVDEVIILDIDFATPRLIVALIAMMVLVYGLIWHTK